MIDDAKNNIFFRLHWRDSPLNSDIDFSGGVVEGVEPALHEKSPLQTKGGDQEVEAHTTKAVAFQEGHEETKSNKDHDMDILEAWRKGNQTLGWWVSGCNGMRQVKFVE